MKLSKEPYKGTRDFYPEDEFVQKYMFNTMRKAVERFGYAEYDASLLEETALYKAKTGEEIVNEQTYSFVDRGQREVTIRPEMTPTVARMVARKRLELAFPLRWYAIPNLWRYERPQRGRLREHWQLNVDMFGDNSILADAEIISVAGAIMKKFGAKKTDFEVHLNNRKLLTAVAREYCGCDEARAYKLFKLIDRRHKMDDDKFFAEAQALLGDKTEKLKIYLQSKTLADLPAELVQNAGVFELKQLCKILAEQGVANVVFDASLMRGFDYYTGNVFEVYDTDVKNRRAMFGGGRYDDLVGIFEVPPVTGIGFGMGDVTMRDFLEAHNLLPQYQPTAQVYLCVLEVGVQGFANELAVFLRQQGINVAVDYTGHKIGKQIQTADKQKIPYVICVGEDEAKNREFKIKQLVSGKENIVIWDDLPKFSFKS